MRSRSRLFPNVRQKENQVTKTNLIALVIDQSSSMAHLKSDLRERTNKLIADIKARKDQDNRVGVYVFSDGVSGPLKDYPDNFKGGNTALLDAVGMAIDGLSSHTLKAFPWEKEADIAKLVIVLTDGEENQSIRFSGDRGRREFRDLIASKQAEGDWTFAFQLPSGWADNFSRTYGIPRDNCTEWEATRKDFERTSGHTIHSMSSFYSSRNAGLRSVKTFYSATTDLSGVKPLDLKQLDNLTSRFAVHTVAKEEEIKPFVETKTKKQYIPGTAFFQLTKPETVHGSKQVALIEKGKKTILGGPNARKLLGLVDHADGKITPGNHSNFDVFVQSTSSNRKLVRGSKVLVLK